MDCESVLKRDHAKVKSLFQEHTTVTNLERKRAIGDQLIKELCIHSNIECLVLYPTMRKCLPNGDLLVKKALEEHLTVENLLNDLSKLSPDQPDWDRIIGLLMRDTLSHIDDEEKNLLPELQKNVTAEEWLNLGRRLEESKGSAPTRPHPHMPKEGMTAKIAAALAAPADKMADTLMGRTK
ncbi:hypothetical protein QOT17_011253 [Balamuthia mandrillaris]